MRWIAVAGLVVAAALTMWAAVQASAPRGVAARVYDNRYWQGEPVASEHWRHADFGSEHSRQNLHLDDDASVRLDAWLYAPRSGLYQLGVESPDDTWVFVDEQPVVTHRRGHRESTGEIYLAQGAHNLKVQLQHRGGVTEFWLRWRLPGKDMDLEPLPPVYLHPQHPDEAASPPLALRAAPPLLLLLALMLGVLPWLGRGLRRVLSHREIRNHVGLAILLFLCTLAVRLADLNGAGETVDEWSLALAGRTYISNMAHGYFESLYWHLNEEHPPLAKYLYGLVSHLSGTASLAPLRATAAVLNGLTVVLVYVFAARWLSGFVAVVAGIILTWLPHFVAFGKVASLEAPGTLMFTLAVVVFVEAVRAEEGRNRRYLIAGLIACLAFATRFSNLLVFAVMVGVHLVAEWRNIRRRGVVDLPLALYVLPALPMLVLLALWPWLWREPFGQMITTLKNWSPPDGTLQVQEWFLGSLQAPPRLYLPVQLVLTTPALLLIPAGAFWIRLLTRRRLVEAVVGLWLLAPFIWSLTPLARDGARFLYSAWPALAIAAGLGLEYLIPARTWRPVAAFGAAIYLAGQAYTVHPFYLDYSSELVGGPRGVYLNRLAETGAFGQGLEQAVAHVNAAAPRGASIKVETDAPHLVEGLRADLQPQEQDPDIILIGGPTPTSAFREGYRPHFTLSAADAPIALVLIKERLFDQMRVKPYP